MPITKSGLQSYGIAEPIIIAPKGGNFSMNSQFKEYAPFVGPFDPCPPIRCKTYVTAPNLYVVYQPPSLPQFNPSEALRLGVLWPAYYSPYEGRK
jgi:spore coat protein JA